MSRIVIALGGNALQKDPKNITAEAQLETCSKTAGVLAEIIGLGNEVIITHGNGPQVGQIISAYETASAFDKSKPVMPYPECGAMSEGYIGYHLQQSVEKAFKRYGINKQVATIITQVVVDVDDPGFKNPTKPIGSFFTKEQAETIMLDKGYVLKEDAGRGWRRVVASPMPKAIVENEIIKTLVESGHVVITAGGGGIPVIRKEDGTLEGVPAVIDKDYASEKVAELVDADTLLILTAVEKVSIEFNKPGQRDISSMSVKEAEQYISEGQFAEGSMLPKIRAALMFVKSRQGRKSIITSLANAKEALEGKTGTLLFDSSISSVSVLGAGIMGSGIALLSAKNGMKVKIYGTSDIDLDKGFKKISSSLNRISEKWNLTEKQRDEIMSRIKGVTSLREAYEGADLIMECLPENTELKQRIFKQLDEKCNPNVILASCTSGIMPSKLAENTTHPERLVVAHFWNPPELIPLVEVVPGKFTSAETMKRTAAWAEAMGSKAIAMEKECPGFIGNRLQHALLREAIYMVEKGYATPRDIDNAVQWGFGRRLPVTGPICTADLAGLDTICTVSESLYKDLCSSPEPSNLLKEKSQKGELGSKTGQGFYKWDAGSLETKDRERTDLLDWLNKID